MTMENPPWRDPSSTSKISGLMPYGALPPIPTILEGELG